MEVQLYTKNCRIFHMGQLRDHRYFKCRLRNASELFCGFRANVVFRDSWYTYQNMINFTPRNGSRLGNRFSTEPPAMIITFLCTPCQSVGECASCSVCGSELEIGGAKSVNRRKKNPKSQEAVESFGCPLRRFMCQRSGCSDRLSLFLVGLLDYVGVTRMGGEWRWQYSWRMVILALELMAVYRMSKGRCQHFHSASQSELWSIFQVDSGDEILYSEMAFCNGLEPIR